MTSVRSLGVECSIWLVTDGAYAGRPVLKPLTDLGVVVFSRLQKDACLFDLPAERKPGQRGRHGIYSSRRIRLAKLAASTDGWESMTYPCRGSMVTREYKTFQATSRLVSGIIHVVIVRFEDGGWAAYFCTDAQVNVRDILETVAARWAIEKSQAYCVQRYTFPREGRSAYIGSRRIVASGTMVPAMPA